MQVIGREAGSRFGGATRVDQPTIEAVIDSSAAAPMYNALKSYFPEDAKQFKDSFARILKESVTADEAFQKMMSVGAEIRRRHTPSLKSAPDASLTAVIESQIQILKQFENDPMVCNQVFAYGPIAIPKDQRSKVVEAAKLSAAILFRAMYEGKNFPVKHAAATEDDWGRLNEEFLSSGGTEKDLDLVSNPDLQDPALCGAALKFLNTAAFAQFDGIDRVRAEFVYYINEG